MMELKQRLELIGFTVASLLKLDTGGKSSESAGSESRIKFKVPMSYTQCTSTKVAAVMTHNSGRYAIKPRSAGYFQVRFLIA